MSCTGMNAIAYFFWYETCYHFDIYWSKNDVPQLFCIHFETRWKRHHLKRANVKTIIHTFMATLSKLMLMLVGKALFG